MALQAPERFTVRSERCDALTLLTLGGPVRGASFEEVAASFSSAIGTPGSTVVIDLAEVVEVDAAGVAALCWFEDRLRDTGRELVLDQPRDGVLAALRRAGLTCPLSTHPAPPAPSSSRRRDR